jgi:hypothetical protein
MLPRPPDGWSGEREVEGTSMDHCWFEEDAIVLLFETNRVDER